VATYFAGLKPGRFAVTPLTGDKDVPLAYDIAMAVRMGEPGWRNQINGLIRANRREIAAILTAARVPLLPMTEEKP
jgi:hypothetical protein